VIELVGQLGELRFREKQQRFAVALASEEADQVLYAGLLTALGYSQNQEAFGVLARLLPYRRLRRLLATSPPASRATTAEALLFGSAGLLPPSAGSGQSPSAGSGPGPTVQSPPYVAELERRWLRLSKEALPHDSEPPAWMWKLDGLRPDNHPVRRIAGAARLLVRAEEGVFRYLLASLERREQERELGPLVDAWTARSEGFWCHHYDLLQPSRRPRGTLIGRGRALEIVTNVALPLAAAWGERAGDRCLARRALALYSELPSPAPYGATGFLQRNLRRGRAAARGTRYQQGLLHLFRNYCTQGGCGRCPLS
jgi:hypothetical protein